MNKVEIMDLDGRKIVVGGIYYISNNNYYFIYTKEESDNEGHIILYILKVLQEVINTPNGPTPTGYLIGTKIIDDNEYNLVKQDIINIINAKQTNGDANVRFLDLSMISNLKVKDNRIFKLDTDIYNQLFKNNSTTIVNNNNMTMDYQQKYEEEVKKNLELKQTIEKLSNKLNRIDEILKEN